ncbi:leucyl aminopeptidase [Ramaria rubella]|nr:leucyl aminopeptidase [Ramaria rubella]
MATTTAASKYRLPLDVKPTHYNITIKTDLDKLEYQGIITIDLEVLENTSSVTFNASHLAIHEVVLYSEALKTEQVETANLSLDDKAERATVQSSNPLAKGSKVQLRMRFGAKLTGDMMGYYYSSYEEQGKKQYYTLTQFEPTAARRAFPCWDEPLLKATYNITLVSRAGSVNLSNMPAASEEVYQSKGSTDAVEKLFEGSDSASGWKVTQFEQTPPVSSYLIAFANGPFEYLESSYTSPLSGKTRPLRIYATNDLINQAQFGLDVKAKVLPIYEKIFDIEFPLPKLDTLVAHDFDAGAMENWGLITGRTAAYLLDPKRVDIAAKKQIASTQTHEVAHMWFGNITTMSWWDNLWLNEGFATLMGSVIILNQVFPEWKVYSSFHTGHIESALTLDAKPSSHPIQVEVPDANDINQLIVQIFDALSYSKAAAVLRMLSVYVGEEKFLKGVSIYLKKHLYANSVAEDLWAGIQEATNLNIPELMNNWTSKIGFPVLTVKESSEGLQIRQDRFLDTGDVKEEDNKTIWHVPLNVLTTDADGKAVIDNQALLKTRETSYKLDVNKTWKINAGSTGVYRVLYTPERLSKLGEEAARPDSAFSLEDRLGLVSDALVLASSGLASTSSALTLINRLRSESEYLVWSAVSQHLGKFNGVWWEQGTAFTDLRAFRRSLFAPIAQKLGYEYPAGESVDTTQLRTVAIQNAAITGSEEVVEKLQGWFKLFLTSGSDSHIPPDLVRPTFSTGVRYGGRPEWEAMRQTYFKPSNPSAKISAMLGMSATHDPALIEATLQFTKDSAQSQDVIYFFFGLGNNVAAGRFYKRFEGNFQLNRLLKSSHDMLSSKKDADDFVEFFKGKDTSKLSQTLPQIVDTILAKAAWIERSKEDVAAWLVQWKKENTTAKAT